MASLAAFKAVTYNRKKVKDISSVVCPPYDVISPEKQDYYLGKSPFNLIHILLGKDTPEENRYQKASRLFKEWLKNDILVQDKSSAFYLYSQEFSLKGERKTRIGFIGLLPLNMPDSATFPHENTRLEAKEDRLKLLKAVKANLSPIFIIFQDKKRVVPRLIRAMVDSNKPDFRFSDEDKTIHSIWKIDSPQLIEMIQSQAGKENFFIADGHHRYEVACAYKEEANKRNSRPKETAGHNFVLAYFTNADSKGLTVLPIHRLVKAAPDIDIEEFIAGLREYFDVEYVKDLDKLFFLMQKAGRSEHVIGMYKDKKQWLLRLKNVKILDKVISDKPLLYRKLDVSILNYLVLEGVLKIDSNDKEAVNFHHDEKEVIGLVDSNEGFIGFFLNPAKIEQIMGVAESGNKMPPKSTFFYPKLLSGLVIHKL